jgi:hypothetical protein
MLRSAMVAGMLALGLGCTALAAGAWQRVVLGQNISVEVPTSVGYNWIPGRDAPATIWTNFTLSAKGRGTLECFLDRESYTGDATREATIAHFQSATRNAMCTAPVGSVNYVVHDSRQAVISGYPAGSCVASATDNSAENKGVVIATMGIAAPSGYLLAVCHVRSTNQPAAITNWRTYWASQASHFQTSPRIP